MSEQIPVPLQDTLSSWLVLQQASVGQMVEDSLPMATGWAEAQGHSLVAAYNLSDVRC